MQNLAGWSFFGAGMSAGAMVPGAGIVGGGVLGFAASKAGRAVMQFAERVSNTNKAILESHREMAQYSGAFAAGMTELEVGRLSRLMHHARELGGGLEFACADPSGFADHDAHRITGSV